MNISKWYISQYSLLAWPCAQGNFGLYIGFTYKNTDKTKQQQTNKQKKTRGVDLKLAFLFHILSNMQSQLKALDVLLIGIYSS